MASAAGPGRDGAHRPTQSTVLSTVQSIVVLEDLVHRPFPLEADDEDRFHPGLLPRHLAGVELLDPDLLGEEIELHG
jgi:hypothetical protein